MNGEVVVHYRKTTRPDCGVCGVPADALVEVTHDGYFVPRCANHIEERPYQAEARLAEHEARTIEREWIEKARAA